mmetsp:Transcript_14355/g.38471  ORF Transcript_14355/g.38471 Transcript_14355/m.38471 type:complete len:174 (-) Transcript_14355:765-1286(-)
MRARYVSSIADALVAGGNGRDIAVTQFAAMPAKRKKTPTSASAASTARYSAEWTRERALNMRASKYAGQVKFACDAISAAENDMIASNDGTTQHTHTSSAVTKVDHIAHQHTARQLQSLAPATRGTQLAVRCVRVAAGENGSGVGGDTGIIGDDVERDGESGNREGDTSRDAS